MAYIPKVISKAIKNVKKEFDENFQGMWMLSTIELDKGDFCPALHVLDEKGNEMNIYPFKEELEDMANEMLRMAHDFNNNYDEKENDPGVYRKKKHIGEEHPWKR